MKKTYLTVSLLATIGAASVFASGEKVEPTPATTTTKPNDMPACCCEADTMKDKNVAVSEKDNGKKIAVKSGQSITVCLPSNPTTGFDWSVKPLPKFLMTDGKPTYQAHSDLVGSGGMWTQKFMLMGSGTGTITAEYKRSFEGDKAPAKTFIISVEAK
jgi:inhibitor of cysteine peptidase